MWIDRTDCLSALRTVKRLAPEFELRRRKIAHRISATLDFVDERLCELAIPRLRCKHCHGAPPAYASSMLPPSARAMLRSCSERTRAPRAKRLCLRLIGAPPASGAPRCSQGEPARQLRESCRARDAGNQAPVAARQQTGSRVPAARRRPERSALFLPTARSIPLSSQS